MSALEKQTVVDDLFLIQAMHLYVLLNVPAVIFFEGLERRPQYTVLDVNKTRNLNP